MATLKKYWMWIVGFATLVIAVAIAILTKGTKYDEVWKSQDKALKDMEKNRIEFDKKNNNDIQELLRQQESIEARKEKLLRNVNEKGAEKIPQGTDTTEVVHKLNHLFDDNK